MPRKIAIIDGHPDPVPERYGHALVAAYAAGAAEGGHDVRHIRIASGEFPVLRSKADWSGTPAVPFIAQSQDTLAWADHIVIVYPLWLGAMPALLKAFLEQTLRPGFAVGLQRGAMKPHRLKGKSARIVVTMGMPALAYRFYFMAHGVKLLKRNILNFCGIAPVRTTLIGSVESVPATRRAARLEALRRLGMRGG